MWSITVNISFWTSNIVHSCTLQWDDSICWWNAPWGWSLGDYTEQTDRQTGHLRGGMSHPLGTSPCLQRCHLQASLKPHWGLGQWLKLAGVSAEGKASRACPSTMAEENTEENAKMGIKKVTTEPQLCGNVKSSHREHKQFPSLSIRKQWQPGNLQKIGLKIPAPKIFAIVLAFLTWLGRHLLWNCCSVRITGLKWKLQIRDAFF